MVTYSVKLINSLILALALSIVLVNCGDGYDGGDDFHCWSIDAMNHYLDSAKLKQIDIRNIQQIKLTYKKDTAILDTIKLLNVGSAKVIMRLKDDEYCGEQIKDYVEGSAIHFIDNKKKSNSLVLNILPVYLYFYEPSYSGNYPKYVLHRSESIEVKWGKYVFVTPLFKLEEATGANFYPTIILGNRVFTNIYKVGANDSTHIYFNKSTIAQITVGKETWTNIE
ncbi:MAG: hypothetical protein EAY81_09910 [Bacteroidetes bacterium]|nr:MAG: hypothetical protein EAY81_09910 [Bacteroidota bacterium]